MDARSDRQSHGWAGEVTDACRGGHWPLRALMWGWFVFLLWHHVRSAEEWDAALAEAGAERTIRTADYLLATPLVADYLAEGLAAFDYRCDD